MKQKMKQLMMTLALLITAATGAWAVPVSNRFYLDFDQSDDTKATLMYGSDYAGKLLYDDSWTEESSLAKSRLKTITVDGSCSNFQGESLESLFNGFFVLTTIKNIENLNTAEVTDMSGMFFGCKNLTSLDLSSFNTAKVEKMNVMFIGCSNLTSLDLSSFNTAKVEEMKEMFYECSMLQNIYVGDGWSTDLVTDDEEMFYSCSYLPNWNSNYIGKNKAYAGEGGYLTYKAAASSGNAFPISWSATSPNTASIEAMPAGNVTVNVKYYPQATAEGAVTAATGVLATTDDPLVTVDKSMLTGVAKMMYYVSTESTAPAYDAEDWTDKLPTAEKYTEAANLNVWYYPVGTDEGVGGATATYSDGDMNATALPVTLGDAPTYNVTLNADGLSTDEAAAWQVAKGTATPAAFPLEGVMRGETVTVTYSGTKKIIGVKAEKTVPFRTLADATTEDVGMVVCAAGHLHEAMTPVPDGCTAVGVLGKVTDSGGHGLILALHDATRQGYDAINDWTSVDTYAGTRLKQLPSVDLGPFLKSYDKLGKTAVSNWCVAQKSDYEAIFTNLDSEAGNADGKTFDGHVNAYITGAGGEAIPNSNYHWSATAYDEDTGWVVMTEGWDRTRKGTACPLRPVLGF